MRAFHPVAEIFPFLDGAEFAGLCEDIREHGQREPIIVDRAGLILDGRNRYRACIQIGVEPKFETYEGADVVALIVSLNLKRRHMSESQRAMVAAKLANLSVGANQHTGASANLPTLLSNDEPPPPAPVTQRQAADLLNVSDRAVRDAKVIQREAAPVVVAAVERGEVSVSAAAKAIKAEPDKAKQAGWTPADIKAVVKQAQADIVRREAEKGEALGEGNAVTAFMREHGRIPSPTEANRIARETGKATAGSDGRFHLGFTKDEERVAAGRADRWFGFKEPVWAIASLRCTPSEILAEIPHYQMATAKANVSRALAILSEMAELLERQNAA